MLPASFTKPIDPNRRLQTVSSRLLSHDKTRGSCLGCQRRHGPLARNKTRAALSFALTFPFHNKGATATKGRCLMACLLVPFEKIGPLYAYAGKTGLQANSTLHSREAGNALAAEGQQHSSSW